MAIETDEYYEPFAEVTRKAAKPHTCKACGETIRPGDTYVYGSGRDCDGWEHWRRCSRCEAIFQHLLARFRAEYPGMVPDLTLSCGDEYRDVWEEEPPPEIAALAFALPGEVVPATGGPEVAS